MWSGTNTQAARNHSSSWELSWQEVRLEAGTQIVEIMRHFEKCQLSATPSTDHLPFSPFLGGPT